MGNTKEQEILDEIEEEWTKAQMRSVMYQDDVKGRGAAEYTDEDFREIYVRTYADVAGRVRRKYNLTSKQYEALFDRTTISGAAGSR